MTRSDILGLMLAVTLPAAATEKVFDFTGSPLDRTPSGFRSALAGTGEPGDWRVILDDVPPLLAPLTDKAPTMTQRPVLAQLSTDPTDERFPLLIYDGGSFGDFSLRLRFKLVSGATEQMAGVAFRLRDEKNFYVIRASGLGRNVRFYKVVNGERSAPIGPQVDLDPGVWHELRIECQGNKIQCWLNDKLAIPTLTDNSFTAGKIAFWTKSDSVTHFADLKLTYTERELPAQAMVRDALKKYNRLRGLQVYTLDAEGVPKIVASKSAEEVGQPGGAPEKDCIGNGTIYYRKDKKSVFLVMPLRDRNGDPMAAVWLEMESFAGQTQQNALARATPIVRRMQARAHTLDELSE